MGNDKKSGIYVLKERSKEERIKTFRNFASRLEQIEGIEEAMADDWNPKYADSAQIIAYVPASKFKEEGKSYYNIKANLRSISQKISHLVKN